MNVDDLVAALRAIPMHVYDDAGSRSTNRPPMEAGMYAWWQTPSALPGVFGTPHGDAALELLYVGIAPRGPDSNSILRARLRNHHRAAIGRSTFRLDLAAFLWEREGWSPYWTDRPALTPDDLAALGAWQREHLSVQWVQVDEPWTLERDVVRELQPPLNRDHNGHHRCYATVGHSRQRLRNLARASGVDDHRPAEPQRAQTGSAAAVDPDPPRA